MNEIERIRLRCVCGEDGCWRWTGSTSHDSLPTVSRTVDGKKKTLSARRWVFEQHSGRKLMRGEVVSLSCQQPDCLNPEHLKASTRAAVQRRSYKADPGRKIRAGAAIRAAWKAKGKGHKLTQEQADYARDPSRPTKDVAMELGVSTQLVQYIRKGKVWRDTANPFAAFIAANDASRRAA